MISSQKVGRVPPEFVQQLEQLESGNVPAENFQFVSTTEKYENSQKPRIIHNSINPSIHRPLSKYKYPHYQPTAQSMVSTDRPYFEEYPHVTLGQKQKLPEAENELDDQNDGRNNYYASLKAYHSQQAHQNHQQARLPPVSLEESQFVSPTPRPYVIASSTARPKRPNRPKYSSSYRAPPGPFKTPSDSVVTSTTPAPYKSVVPSFRKLKTTAFYAPSSTVAPLEPGSYFATTPPRPLNPPHPSGQHLTETSFAEHPRISTYHPKISKERPVAEYPSQYYYLDQQQAVATTTLAPVPRYPVRYEDEDPLRLDDNQSLSQLLKKLQDSNHLPKTLTADNIDNSIKTLIKILNNLKQSPSSVPDQHLQQPAQSPGTAPDYNDNNGDDYYDKVSATDPLNSDDSANHVDGQLGANSGTPGVDYPNLFEIPQTEFNCKEQRYKGFFGDPETRCQVWHYCDLNGGQASFLCPNGTIFSQVSVSIK